MELNSGIQSIIALILGQTVDQGGNSVVPFGSSAQIAIGDGDGAVPTVAATDTQLAAVGTTGNVIYLTMSNGYPQASGETMIWQGQATSSEGNFAWNEWGVTNGATPPIYLNHKGIALGTKVVGETWTFQAEITQS